MPLPDAQIQACLRALGKFLTKRRPPEHIRDRLDYRTKIEGSDVIILEVRPAFDDPSRTIESPVAKVKWVGTRKKRRLFWMRADLKWHSYTPNPETATIDAALAEVDRDPHCCFFG